MCRLTERRLHCNQIQRTEREQDSDDCEINLQETVFAITLQPVRLTGSELARDALGRVAGMLVTAVGIRIQSRSWIVDCVATSLTVGLERCFDGIAQEAVVGKVTREPGGEGVRLAA